MRQECTNSPVSQSQILTSKSISAETSQLVTVGWKYNAVIGLYDPCSICVISLFFWISHTRIFLSVLSSPPAVAAMNLPGSLNGDFYRKYRLDSSSTNTSIVFIGCVLGPHVQHSANSAFVPWFGKGGSNFYIRNEKERIV